MVVDHVRREALPWRPPLTKTECGRLNDRVRTISRAEFAEIRAEWNTLVRDYRRAGMDIAATVRRPNVCRICWETAERWPTWERLPIRALYRELDQFGFFPDSDDAIQTCRELWALGRLAEMLPDRFAQLVAEFDRGYRRA